MKVARAIGVCNFNLPMLRLAVNEICAPAASVQVEHHPFLDRYREHRRCRRIDGRYRWR
jgi:2,5-diketo-D-gluconate reductase B